MRNVSGSLKIIGRLVHAQPGRLRLFVSRLCIFLLDSDYCQKRLWMRQDGASEFLLLISDARVVEGCSSVEISEGDDIRPCPQKRPRPSTLNPQSSTLNMKADLWLGDYE